MDWKQVSKSQKSAALGFWFLSLEKSTGEFGQLGGKWKHLSCIAS